MFDESCYNTAWGTMDSDFRKGKYNLVKGSPQTSYIDDYYTSSKTSNRPNPYSTMSYETSSSLPRHMADHRSPMIYGSTGRLNSPSSRSYIASRTTQAPLNRNPPSYSEEKPSKYLSTSNLYNGNETRNYGNYRSGTPTGRYLTEREKYGTSSRPTNHSSDRHLIFDGSTSQERRNESRNEWQPEKAFLGEIQRELEHQRRNLSGEVDRLLLPMNELNVKQTPIDADKNSFVDTSSGKAIFKAFVDVSDYPEDSVKIRLDSIAKKIIVEAGHVSANSGSLSSTFTQKIALPRYADETKMDAKLNSKGVVKIEIPLLFYFPEDEQKNTLERKSKTFVNGVSSTPDGRKEVEIIVKIGNEIHPSDLRVEVLRDKLSVYTQRGDQKRVINTYRLPPGADVTAITSHRQNDGQLVIKIPVGGSSL